MAMKTKNKFLILVFFWIVSSLIASHYIYENLYLWSFIFMNFIFMTIYIYEFYIYGLLYL
jgi:hypothetical protein